ncbi:hypothetical protein BLNAU_25158 [Blattamonas nauphoetae]|uniref:Uncharacterized protein n=1 Tax=Blattamonas nauphoetae TaxID=2049346 RepID=A0ABQ9WKE1_9EUKA|nr:hypothetical protein BLNAU_25158 [Blattamonas nauphoetae]
MPALVLPDSLINISLKLDRLHHLSFKLQPPPPENATAIGMPKPYIVQFDKDEIFEGECIHVERQTVEVVPPPSSINTETIAELTSLSLSISTSLGADIVLQPPMVENHEKEKTAEHLATARPHQRTVHIAGPTNPGEQPSSPEARTIACLSILSRAPTPLAATESPRQPQSLSRRCTTLSNSQKFQQPISFMMYPMPQHTLTEAVDVLNSIPCTFQYADGSSRKAVVERLKDTINMLDFTPRFIQDLSQQEETLEDVRNRWSCIDVIGNMFEQCITSGLILLDSPQEDPINFTTAYASPEAQTTMPDLCTRQLRATSALFEASRPNDRFTPSGLRNPELPTICKRLVNQSIRVGAEFSRLKRGGRVSTTSAELQLSFPPTPSRSTVETTDWTRDHIPVVDEDNSKREVSNCHASLKELRAHAARAAGDSSGTSCDRQVGEDGAGEAALDEDHSHQQAADSSPVLAFGVINAVLELVELQQPRLSRHELPTRIV